MKGKTMDENLEISDDTEQMLCLQNDNVKFHENAAICFHVSQQRLSAAELTELREKYLTGNL